MGSTGPTEVTAEVERKYDVEPATTLPTLAGVDGIARVGQPVEHLLEAVYYDTAGLDLARSRITLRRRTGGADAGWHLKLPGGDDLRTEVRLPLDAADDPAAVPDALLEPVRTVVRDRPLAPVAVLRSRRREQDLLDDRGSVVAHLCDDEVEAESPAGRGGIERWREWEVELTGDDTGLLDTVEERLVEAGAAPAGHSSKLRRALGDRLPRTTPPPGPDSREWSRASTADVLRAYLGEHRAALHHHDPGVRQGDPESVHKMRVAARRLRSALTTYRPVLGRDVADPLRAELRWLGLALSGARDTHVLRSRLSGVLDAEPPELVVGPVVARLDKELASTEHDGQQSAVQALGSTRYYRLLDALDAVVDADPGHPESGGRAATEVPALVRRDWRRLRRAVEEVGLAEDGDAHDRALHEARKKAKRLRYAAESAATVRPREATALATAAEAVQEALGEHHDTVVARAHLRSVAMTAHLSGENAFTFGRLHALEQWRAERAEQAFDAAWQSLSRRRLRRWLRPSHH
ncbi:CYTH and CHAD domain-containing protein [Knoellia sp. 3-2P3]|uniref:CYTH and CHAD domain-containing protein n=1 Tax=unclassified Knoellia TaxID=2618719 RepID=UPI0023DCBEAE|nr:CYTH and CHAD domain-containing protein [Knoellia sp. 3-2P3]MDF2092909.1 CYTH and CHAD domain-containing protein [Knoellia sp. 3-2P3]